jgi:hypothetical protein
MSYTTFSHCGTDHAEWLKSIDFYKNEFDILEERLLEVVKKNNGAETMAQAEHFQNQFIIQRENIDDLKHRIHEHTGKVATDIKEHAGKIGIGLVGEHDSVGDKFKNLEKIINDLRHEFNLFLAKRM